MRLDRCALFLVLVSPLFGACSDDALGTVAASSSSTSSSGSGGSAVQCGPSDVDGVNIAATDVYGGPPYALGYPPYAIDGCHLVYVAPAAKGAGSGELRLRDLATGTETTLALETEEPRRPSIAGDVIAWESTIANKPVVRVRAGDATTTVSGAFDHAGEPRAAKDAVVFTAWLGADDLSNTDVLLYVPGGGITAIATGPGQQRFADVSASDVAWSDFSEDPDGVFNDASGDVADIGVYSRATGSSFTRKRPGKQAFPMLGSSGKLGFLDWGLVHPEPKFSAYDFYVADVNDAASLETKVAHIQTEAPYVRPSARAALVDWVEWEVGAPPALWQRPADLSAPAETVGDPAATELYGPAATDAMTVLAARSGSGPMHLIAVAR